MVAGGLAGNGSRRFHFDGYDGKNDRRWRDATRPSSASDGSHATHVSYKPLEDGTTA